MEFVSYDELKEYYEDRVPGYIFKNGSYFVEEKESSFVPEIKEEPKRHVLRTLMGNGRGYMYLGKKGITFQKWQAVRFKEETAKTKAKFMRENSRNGYSWEAVRI